MHWESRITEDLHQAKSERASLKELACSNVSKLSMLKWKQEQLDNQIYKLCKSMETYHEALQTVEGLRLLSHVSDDVASVAYLAIQGLVSGAQLISAEGTRS